MALKLRSGIWHWRKEINGHTMSRSTKTGDEKLAKEMAKRWEHEAVQTIVFDGERPVTLHEAIKQFLEARRHAAGWGSACGHMEHWRKMADVPMKSVKLRDAEDLLVKWEREGQAWNTLVVRVTYWNALMNFCADKKLSAGPKLPGRTAKATKLRFLNAAEEEALYAALSPEGQYPGKTALKDYQKQANQDLMVCLLHLGARIREAETLRWSDVNFEDNTVFVRRLKNGNDCLLVMSAKLRSVMERRRAAEPDAKYVFPTKWDHVTNMNWINVAVEKAGISLESGKITSHCFRHTAATWLLKSGMDVVEVQKYLGHRNLASTVVYLHAIPSEVAHKAAAVFDK